MCSDFMLARSVTNFQSQRPTFLRGSFGSIFSRSPRFAKHSIRIDLTQQSNGDTELNFQLRFLSDNIALLSAYMSLVLIVWIASLVPPVGIFFVFLFIVTASIHIPWWLISRRKVRKEFWNFIDTKVQTSTRIYSPSTPPPFFQNLGQQNIPNKSPPPPNTSDETDIYPGNQSSSQVPLPSVKHCSKCNIDLYKDTRYCPKCGKFLD
jgi:hypothetical protein